MLQSNANGISIASVSAHLNPHYLRVEWEGGARNDFNFCFLRDNCLCQSCFDRTVGERVFLTSDIPLDIHADSAKVDSDEVTVCWNDGHVSKYSSAWLRENVFADPMEDDLLFHPLAWDASYASTMPRFDYERVLSSASVLLSFLETFRDRGIAIIENAPAKDRESERFADYLAYVREIAFDRVANIRISPDAYTQGFTDAPLHPHTDCSGYRWPPNVFVFHCMENTVAGGESVYVDGELAVNRLRAQNPECFEFLSTTPIMHRLYSKKFDTVAAAPVISMDKRNHLAVLRYANWTAQPVRLSLRDTQKYYESHRAMSRLINAPENQMVIRLAPGNMAVVNNHRVLHGRKSFDSAVGNRHFQQVYMEMDDLLGRIRMLRLKTNS